MPMKPHKGESQDAFMGRCVPDMIGTGPDKRPQDQAVAICLDIWKNKDKDKKAAKQVDPPDDDESEDDFMSRCTDELTDEMDDDAAEQACSLMWDERKAKNITNEIIHKVNAKGAVVADDDGLEFILSDESIDRLGDQIMSDGWDIRSFKKNPIALFNHQSSFPIGRWKNIHVTDKALRAKLELAPAGTSERVDEIRKLVDAGILKATSVGFKPIKWEALDPDAKESFFAPQRFLKQELVETSLVSVPANPNALAIAKALQISSATRALVFGEHANRDQTRRRGLTGEHAAHSRSNGRTGDMTLAQRIAEAQGRKNTLCDELEEHLGKVDNTNVSDADLQKSNDLHQHIAQVDKQINSLLESEKWLARTSDAGNGRAIVTSGSREVTHASSQGETQRPLTIPRSQRQEVKPIEHVVRAGVVRYIAHLKRVSMEAARSQIALMHPYYNDEGTRGFCEYVERAATAPAMTTVSGWAAELVTQINADFVQLLMPRSIFPRLSNMGLALAFGRAGRIVVPTRSRTPTIAGSFVGEGQPIPVRKGAFTSTILTPKKLAVITEWTRELDEHSIPAIEGLLRNAIQEDTAVALDSILLDTNPATTVRPAGLLNGVTPLTPVAGGGFDALVGDLKALTGQLLTATLGNVRAPVFLMNPQQVQSISLTNVYGNFPFKDEVARGTLLGWPIIDSGTVPLGTVIALDAADFLTVGGDAPRFEITDQATLHEEDTTPLAIGTAGTPAVVAAPVRSLWQTDSLALRLIQMMNWAMRRTGVVSAVNTVTW
jgi:HK97 family phage major capsid protein/HK97 family phage prohead protease